MEKKLILISNALEHFEDNTLVDFKNYIPPNFLESHLNWSIRVESCHFHAIFKNHGLPKNNIYPSFLQIKREELPFDIENKTNLDLDIFQDRHRIYIESAESYSAKELDIFFKFKTMNHYKINPRPQFYAGFPTKFEGDVIKFGQFSYPFESINENDRSGKRTILLFHDNFANALHFENHELLKPIMINDEQYHFYVNKSNSPKLISAIEIDLNNTIPKIIKICSPNIEPVIVNNQFGQELKSFTLSKSDIDRYCHNTFFSKEYHHLRNKVHNSFEIQLRDENNQALRLRNGIATIIKLHLKSNMSQDIIPIHISSDKSNYFPNNKNNSFKVQLPTRLDFSNGEWKVALSSISFDNHFKILPELDLSFQVVEEEQSLNSLSQRGEEHIPNVSTLNEVVSYFRESITDIAYFFQKTQSSRITLKFKKNGIIKIGAHLSKILGSNVEEVLTIRKQKSDSYIFPLRPQNIEIHPTLAYIYGNFCDMSICGGYYSRLLKIVPISHKTFGERVTEEFETLEYIPTTTSVIQLLEVSITSHTGQLLEFINESDVNMSLIFQKSK